MIKNRISWRGSTRRQRLVTVVVMALLVGVVDGRGQMDLEPERPTTYHVRLLRVVWQDAVAGSALFRPEEIVVPLSEQETWGDDQQLAALRGALGATRIEPLPGLVVRSGPTEGGALHLFRLAMGEAIVEISFQGAPVGAGWHRIELAAYGDRGTEILNSVFRIQGDGTVGVAAPLTAVREALLIVVTPLTGTRSAISEPPVVPTGRPVTLPRTTHMQPPIYPPSAREQGLTGKVSVQLVVRTDGRTDGIVVLSMPEGGEWLAGATVEAIRQWRYEPARKAGRPVDAYFNVVITFTLGDS